MKITVEIDAALIIWVVQVLIRIALAAADASYVLAAVVPIKGRRLQAPGRFASCGPGHLPGSACVASTG